jgi:hypothetical protein
VRKFHRVKSRPAWDCDSCGYHLHPTAGTIFHKSSTSLHLWFYAMYLVTSTRCGISAKQLERELGVTYKTAWRMLNLIRNELMAQDDEPLSGDVEADETAWGGRPRLGDVEKFRREGETDLSGAGGRWKQHNKSTVFAMVERGGRVRATVVPSRQARRCTAKSSSTCCRSPRSSPTSGRPTSGLEARGYRHRRIRHTEKVYVSGTFTRRPSKGSSRTSSAGSPGPTTRSRRSGFSPTSTSTSGATTGATMKELLGPLREDVDRFNDRLRREYKTHMSYANEPDGSLWSVTWLDDFPDPPADFGLAAGDVMHNIRSALDHLVCALVRADGRTPSKQNGFPIYENKPTTQRSRQRYAAAVKGLTDKHKAWIKQLQPYNDRGVGSLLWIVGFFDNLDKHQEVAPVFLGVELSHDFPSVVGPKGPQGAWAEVPKGPLKRGSWLVRIFEPTPTKPVIVGAPLEIGVNFGIPRLDIGMIEAVRDNVVGIVESFGPLDIPAA